ncbi:MAG TPA: diaminopimelate decarboxylase [Vicinamibacterales bacterium]|nr:diaminopimelate decarboxylase [Vicinamibacterales bacterium]
MTPRILTAAASAAAEIAAARLEAIAAAAGTPAYVYEAGHIRAAYAQLDAAFGGTPHAIHYAMKANSSLAIVRLVRTLGSAADANSMGEVEVALRCGFAPSEIVFTGVGKRHEELERAVSLGLLAINVESPGELERLAALAADRGAVARVALRVNPDIDARSHPHISTGLKANKFGVPIEMAPALFRDIAARPSLAAVGIHVHIGSQITTLDPLEHAAEAIVRLARALGDEGIHIEHLDFGGGVGIAYDGGAAPDPAEYVRRIVGAAGGSGLKLAIEPGRVLVGPAGALLTRVVDVKQFPGARRFVVLDAGMTELMRPALYGAFHRIDPVRPRPGQPVPADIVGPICESTDTFARDRELLPVEVGDLMVIRDAGAYGAAMGSNYLRRPLPPEVMVDGAAWRITRRRQTLDDMLALEEDSADPKTRKGPER